MTQAALRCVVDASVGIKLFRAEALSDQAHALFAHLAADPPGQLFVPDLFYIECANILWKHVRRSAYPAEKAQTDLEDLSQLILQSVPTAELMSDALQLAITREITAYDACYLALAQRVGVPFITADEKLARALASAPDTTVRWLGDLSMLPGPEG